MEGLIMNHLTRINELLPPWEYVLNEVTTASNGSEVSETLRLIRKMQIDDHHEDIIEALQGNHIFETSKLRKTTAEVIELLFAQMRNPKAGHITAEHGMHIRP